jgi:hypothetical protein
MREIWLPEDLHITRAVRPGGPGGLTGSRLCKPSRSCILARDLLGFQLLQGQVSVRNVVLTLTSNER